jgi:Fur family transcriptional regulator, peroxide stress response regulator
LERTVPRPRLYRDAILALLRRNPTHPTVDWIHQELRKREPRVSLATVYRTLRVLVAEGVLCELPFGAGQSRFGLVKDQNHYHFICDSCGHIHDLPGPRRAGLEAAVAKATGNRVIRHTTEFFGTCKTCLAHSASPANAKKKAGPRNTARHHRRPSRRKQTNRR